MKNQSKKDEHIEQGPPENHTYVCWKIRERTLNSSLVTTLLHNARLQKSQSPQIQKIKKIKKTYTIKPSKSQKSSKFNKKSGVLKKNKGSEKK